MLIKRNATEGEVINDTPVEGNLVRVKTPKFISLVAKPANQTAYKVVRNDQGDSPMSTALIRRTRRSDPAPILRLSFPEGFTEDQASAAMTLYGLQGYTIESTEAGITATRADLKSISPDSTMQIKLTDEGLMATVARSTQPVADKAQLTLAAIEFDSAKFNADSVASWLAEKSVDGTLQQPENSGTSFVVRRSEVLENEETRRIELEDGVVGVITRSDDANIPDGYAAVVSEAAYGSWGWGQLDFTAMMADRDFCTQMDEATYRLRNLLDQIILYSQLPLDVRKDLANRALAQYGEYIGAILDSLPRQLLVSVVRSANPPMEKSMKQAEAGNAGVTGGTPEPIATPLTRADVEAMIAAAVAAKPAEPAAIARSETGEGKETPPEGTAPVTPEPVAALTRADLEAILAPINASVEAIKGLTVVRSSNEAAPAPEQKKDVFRGALFGGKL